VRANFQPADDVQLWRVTDVIDGREYAWPLLVTPGNIGSGPVYQVRPGVPFSDLHQHEFVHSRLDPDALEIDNSRWLVRPTRMADLAVKCEGITPKFYVKWGEPPTSAEAPKEDLDPTEGLMDKDFLNFLVASGPEFPTKNIALMSFLRICNCAQQWLLEHHRPVDLRFVVLRAFPYRKNWLPILHKAHSESLPQAVKDGNLADVADKIGLRDSLYCVDLAAMQGNQTFAWSIEATPTRHFDKAVLATETQALAYGPNLYLKRWSKLVTKLYDSTLEAVRSWVEASALPLGAVDTTLPENLWSLGARRSRGRVRNVAPPPPETYFSTHAHDPGNPVVDNAGGLRSKNADVSEVPDAKFDIQLVRPHRRVGRARVADPGVLVPAGPGGPVPE
jgi:hypothetical protein